MNTYPLWKYLLVVFALVIGLLYASPNLYTPDPAIQISGSSSSMALGQDVLSRAEKALDEADIEHHGGEFNDSRVMLRLYDQELQLKARAVVQAALGPQYVVALNLAANTPDWLTRIGAGPMKLGLDLSGGVHFLLEVETDAAVKNRLNAYEDELKTLLRQEKVRGVVSQPDDGSLSIVGEFRSAALRDKAVDIVKSNQPGLARTLEERDGTFLVSLHLTEAQIKEIESYAVSQNLTTLRNRVNELGVAEPLVQRQGANRIVVELPGVQDTAEAKRILGKTANLEFRLEAKFDDSIANKERFEFRDKNDPRGSAYLTKSVVITGDRVANAQSSFDENGRPQVNITLDGQGGKLMNRATRNNIKRNLGVLFVERKVRHVQTTDADGNPAVSEEKYYQREIISLATIQSALGTQFRITGLDSTGEASELALLLRAGALAAPLSFVEERTVGPSLGKENIELGTRSVFIGLAAVLIFMLVYYHLFGLIANLALFSNIVLLIACMSILSATLTLPGIAGIVLTVGMAVDANVLIFERIREELRQGVSPHAAINSGYDRAFVTIMDANITTLLVAVILYAVGTGPVRGFAVTLSLGIVTSMFTAIVGTRAMVNLTYGGRRINSLSIGRQWGRASS